MYILHLCSGSHGDGLHGTHAGVETAENDFPAASMFVDRLEDDVSHHVTLKVGEPVSGVLCVYSERERERERVREGERERERVTSHHCLKHAIYR